jgi:hypothetical protein
MKYSLWFFIIITLFACKKHQEPAGNEIQKPDSIISRRQMVMILTDVQLTEAAMGYLTTKGDPKKNLSADDYYNAVFSKYKISRKNFETNFDFYKRDQEDLIKIYEEVIKNLENMRKKGQPKEE